ncbi:hypothetical protein SAMN05518672_1011325 [Chitinophaga sp. CF118]|uniref:hypothetical protein n=1 Tax=Chitinophaga sp. CF118 TaxID=1884367 RepID=UPI0008E12BC0|nr:hypothetical protein [Chitinophaga sp. CF118]SFD26022.1 hypothetical protein SAMN05518672_1011325 [Chitinophaga sp. CF118]
MFSLFRREIININSVSISDFGWAKAKDDKSIIQWINPEQTISISVNFFEKPPDIPTIKNIETLRSFYRHLISGVNGGLIEVALSEKDTRPFIKTIFKLPQEGSGMTYIGSLTFPFKTCSFVFKVQAVEIGITGMREALIADKLISNKMISVDENGYSNWSADPYDNNFKDGPLMNKSEQYVYDIEFPDHPLTQARQILKQIEMSLQWKPVVEKVPVFEE